VGEGANESLREFHVKALWRKKARQAGLSLWESGESGTDHGFPPAPYFLPYFSSMANQSARRFIFAEVSRF